MALLSLHSNALGFEVHDGERLMTLYRACEELPRDESPKPCYAPIHTPSGGLVTEYRPADHPWHTGLYFGWVHVNQANLWGGPWYLPDKGKYESVPHSHGSQRHDAFSRLEAGSDGVVVEESLTWLDADDHPLAAEVRTCRIRALEVGPAMEDVRGYEWRIGTRIVPAGDRLILGASRAARYSGLELRLGPPFAEANHRCSEGRTGHESIMRQRARWVSAEGAAGGAVVMMDHPANPRHPVTWFTRANLLGAGLLMEGDLELQRGQALELRYGLLVLDQAPSPECIEARYADFAARRA